MAPSADAREPSLTLTAKIREKLRANEIRVPPYPAVASQIDELVRSGKANVPEVAALVGADAALAASVLRNAASAAQRSNAPPTLEAAIGRLGFDELTRVVIAATVGVAASAAGPLAQLRRDQWRRSLLAAMFCKSLAARRNVPPDQAFLAGLLHEFGAIVAVACIESLGAPLPVLAEPTWRHIVDDVRGEVSQAVVSRWQLPPTIAEVVAGKPTNAPEPPLVRLVALADRIIAVLDANPDEGVAAIAGLPGLQPDEPLRIAQLMPKVAEQMARFETPRRSTASSVAALSTVLEGGWDVDFPVEGANRAEYRACALAPSAFAFRSPNPLPPAWLVELTLRCPPEDLAMLANVKACEPAPAPASGFLVTAQPFGLAGPDKAAWLRLLSRTRRVEQPTR